MDDDPGIRQLLVDVLPDQVTAVGTAEEALAQLGRGFDLLILDGQLPGLSGPSLLARLNGTRPPVLAITADHVCAAQFRGLGVPTLEKPFDVRSLMDEVDRLLGVPA